MIGKLKDLMRTRDGEWLVSFTTREDPRELFDEMNGKAVRIDVKEAKKHRSLSANAYAWVLIDKIAEKTGISVREVYQTAIMDIGGVSELYGVKEEAYEAFKRLWIGDHLGRQVEIIPGSSKPGWLNVKAWKGSSDFDSVQMHRLIESLIQEAEQQGIPTVSDAEAERMLSQWGKRNGETSKDTKADIKSAV